MEPTLLIVVAVVVVVIALVLARVMGKSGKALAPSSQAKPVGGESAKPLPSKAEAATPKQGEPSTSAAEPHAAGATPSAAESEAEAPAEAGAGAPEEAETEAAVESAEPSGPIALRTGPTADDVRAVKESLKTTRGGFIARLASLFGGRREIDPALLDELEEILITADIGVKTSDKILSHLKEKLARDELGDEARVWEALREEGRAILAVDSHALDLRRKPTVILVVGVNGVGKTTTIGKLASRLTQDGKKCLLVAGDTFRAAAVLQLEVWGRRVGCEVVKGKDRADPSSVIFDAIERGKASGVDVIIADTAGRLHTKAPLMDELSKVGRTVEKALGRPADEILLVLDSTTGQNAIQQAQIFKEALPVSGIVLTKLDGTAKGGVVLGIVDEHQVPVRYVGIGERVEDLKEFDPASFVDALFERPSEDAAASAE
jgi:fused signal recognition particle receptor